MENKILVTGIDLADALRIARVSLEAGQPSAFIVSDPSSGRPGAGTHAVTIEFPPRGGAETAAAFVKFIAEVVHEVSVSDLLKAPDDY
ncbi:hypothetical protein [Blastococcus tunisiensis]|uniref:hypothetical protein n=1 Tax=Blastococcus tunisiensis TaxID=1798228 RepID=UPI001113FCAD|nr:hypothetical protein [Blastococcus sp. DSM 46838]